MSVITLTTDFGTKDWFVGTMKGVILSIDPSARIVDLTHDIPAGDIREGAFALTAACRFFPRGSIHVVVVDPGVGSPRPAIAENTRNHVLVGPDNGVLSLAVAAEPMVTIRRLTNSHLFLPQVSRTFHGRDVFAPVAAHLSRGTAFSTVGAKVSKLARLDWPEPKPEGDRITGEIVHIDRFGNAITNIAADEAIAQAGGLRVILGRRPLCAVAEFYQAVPRGKPVAVFGSTGMLEIAVNGGSAAKRFQLRRGQRVQLKTKEA